MVHTIKNSNGTVLRVSGYDNNNVEKCLKELIQKIVEEKKLPYNDVYVNLSPIIFEQFIVLSKNKNLSIKDIGTVKTQIMVKF
jgi:actin-like ATPase involved in cell morphogenesis